MTVKSPWSNSTGNPSNQANSSAAANSVTCEESASTVTTPSVEGHPNSGQGLSGGAKAAQRPKAVTQWSVVDVQKWFRRNCGDYYHLYWEKFLEQDITGCSLVRLSENSLLRLGIVHPEHRQAIWREIAKLRLRTNIVFLRDLERRSLQQQQDVQ